MLLALGFTIQFEERQITELKHLGKSGMHFPLPAFVKASQLSMHINGIKCSEMTIAETQQRAPLVLIVLIVCTFPIGRAPFGGDMRRLETAKVQRAVPLVNA